MRGPRRPGCAQQIRPTWPHRRRPRHIRSYAAVTVGDRHGRVELAAAVAVTVLGGFIGRYPLSSQPQPGAGHG